MKVTQLSIVLTSLALVFSSGVYAEDSYNKNVHQQNMLSKRPYQAAPEVVENSSGDKWEGATLVTDNVSAESVDNKGADKHQQMRINMLGKRPYIERATD